MTVLPCSPAAVRAIPGKEGGKCIYEGLPVPPDMPGRCGRCSLYLDTCAPVIRNGCLTGAECDEDYCACCPAYEGCSMYFP